MTLEQYGEISNIMAGSAFAVLFGALIVHIAEWIVANRSEQLVSVDAGSAPSEREQERDPAVPSTADRLSGVGVSLTVLGTILITLASITRSLASGRLPLGNMYEFGLSGATVALIVYVVMIKLSKVQWLAVPVLATVLLVFGLSLSTYVPAGPLVPSLNTFWKYIHVPSIILASGRSEGNRHGDAVEVPRERQN